MFKENIATALRTKYQRFGLSNEAIDRIASAREKTVTSEEDVESAVADAETMGLIANELQKMRDVEIQKRTDTQRAFDAYKEKNPEQDPKEPPTNPKPKEQPEPEWAKKLRERFEREDKEKEEREVRDAITARLKMEGCTNGGILKSTMKGFVMKDGETEDSAVERLKSDYNSLCTEVFGDGGVPGFGGQPFNDAKTATDHKNAFLRKQGLLPKEDK